MEQENLEVEIGKMHCTNCGAELNYKPGTTELVCEYCQTKNEIPVSDEEIKELDFHEYLENMMSSAEQVTEKYIKCSSCGASSTMEPHITAADCTYCGTSLILEDAKDEVIIQPKSLLPFKLTKDEAKAAFKKWINGLWFAPDKLKKAALNFEHLHGIYIPYWTFDTLTHSSYFGQRGTYYYVTETYQSDGKTKTRQVRKTRWRSVSGNVTVNFDDILVVATKSLSQPHIEKLEPWDLQNLMPYEKSFLSGFVSEKYQVDLGAGFERAKQLADDDIRRAIMRDIGGDTQRIISKSSRYDNITFKHILLPVYVSAFKFKDKVYQFFVNARTGEVQGERPWSWVKITLAVLLGIVVIGTIWYFTQNK
ncbi:hypothetical protein [Fulvivirga lutimaris]|uniref:hypothetical protein n=1 Tax=Fulvivirga lutimaris TaxID=1819566 RepID=UPI0012BD6D8C|nr:hypothetical protein [Fulvivirga lutimaris]MTI41190.1 hypothetical protein [Fulvivirga lutimaris]